jgi:hypothetical protein
MSRAVFLLPFIGRLPSWLELFFTTAARNPDYRFVVFHDGMRPPTSHYPNIEWHTLTFEDLRRRMSTVLGMEIPEGAALPIKVCDYRPAFGELFANEIGDTPFWGYSDLDQFWGRLDPFLTPEVFENDVISGHRRRLCGPFTLYRNTPRINQLYRSAPRLQEILFDPALQFFEEVEFSNHVLAAASAGQLRLIGGVGNHAHSESKGRYIYIDGKVLRQRAIHDAVSRISPAIAEALPGHTEHMFFHFRTWKSTISYDFDPAAARGWEIGPTRLTQIPGDRRMSGKGFPASGTVS